MLYNKDYYFEKSRHSLTDFYPTSLKLVLALENWNVFLGEHRVDLDCHFLRWSLMSKEMRQ